MSANVSVRVAGEDDVAALTAEVRFAMDSFPNSTNFFLFAELAFVAIILSAIVGIPLGVLAAVNRNSWLDHVLRIFTVSGLALDAAQEDRLGHNPHIDTLIGDHHRNFRIFQN